MALEAITLEHVASTYSVHVAFFKEVSNTQFLQSQLLARNQDFEYAFIDASSVVSRLQVLAATFRAISTVLDGNLRTPNVHSEIVYSLSHSNNISEAYRRWGISPTTKDIIVVKVLVTSELVQSNITAPISADDLWTHLQTHVHGTNVPFSDEEIAGSTDWSNIRRYYKLNGVAGLDGIKDEKARQEEMEALILGSMALRGV